MQLTSLSFLIMLAVDTGAAAPATSAPATTSTTTPTTTATPCVASVPRVTTLGRANVQSTCGSAGTVLHEGDVVKFSPRGVLRLEAIVEGGRELAVTCVAAADVSARVQGKDAPWLMPIDASCGEWRDNERVCRSAGGEELLVCDAEAAALERADRTFAQPLGVPTWYVGDLPPAAAQKPARKLTRVVVQEVSVSVQDLPPERLQGIFTSSLVSEIRKLDGVSVVGLDEVKALIEHAADRQVVGCDEAGCMAEIADALGADLVITARLAVVDESHVIAFRRLDAATAKVDGVDKRFDKGNGEEFLAAIGPAVAELFPEAPLLPGRERGVDKEIGRRLNPPPLPSWAFFTTAGVGAGLLAVGATTGVTSSLLTASVQERIDASVDADTPGRPLKNDYDVALGAAYAADAMFIVGGAAMVAAGGMALFTDFWGYGDE